MSSAWHQKIEHTIWFRPYRQLLEDGKPVGPVTALHFELDGTRTNAFAAIQTTPSCNMVFWPTTAAPWFDSEGAQHPRVDHITITPSNGKMHFTGFDGNGSRAHWNCEGNPVPVGDGALQFCFGFAVRWQHLESQIREMEIKVPFPTADHDRRIAEYREALSKLTQQFLALPESNSRGDYGVCLVYMGAASGEDTQFGPEHIPGGFEQLVNDYDGGTRVRWLGYTQNDPDSRKFMLVIGAPPGKLKGDTAIMFGRRKDST